MVMPLPNCRWLLEDPQPHAVFLIAIPRFYGSIFVVLVDRFFFLTVHCQVAIIIIFTASAGSEYPQNRTDLTGSRGII